MRSISLGRSTLVAIAGDLALAASTLISTPYLIRALGTETYGVLALFTVLTGQLIGLQLGIGWAATRRVAEQRSLAADASRQATLAVVILLSTTAAVLMAGAFLLLGSFSW